MSAPSARAGHWFVRGGWWFPVHVLSLGILAVVPYTHAAYRSRRAGHVVLAGVAWLLLATVFALTAAAEKDAAGQVTGAGGAAGGLVLLFLFVAGLAGLVVVRHQVYGAGAPPAAPPPSPAMARALAARSRREEARRLVATDPLLARELRVGRPDLPREHDDGGLVDLNSAPPGLIADLCGLEPAQAGRIVQARQAIGRFGTVDDVFAYAEMPVELWDRVRDRAIVL